MCARVRTVSHPLARLKVCVYCVYMCARVRTVSHPLARLKGLRACVCVCVCVRGTGRSVFVCWLGSAKRGCVRHTHV